MTILVAEAGNSRNRRVPLPPGHEWQRRIHPNDAHVEMLSVCEGGTCTYLQHYPTNALGFEELLDVLRVRLASSRRPGHSVRLDYACSPFDQGLGSTS